MQSQLPPVEYLFAGILLLLTLGLATTMVIVPGIVSKLLRLNKPSVEKLEPYECGMQPVGGARGGWHARGRLRPAEIFLQRREF